jgi:hypothetical protein
MRHNELVKWLDAIVPWLRATVLLMGLILLGMALSIAQTKEGQYWSLIPLLGAAYAFTWATPYPLSAHWLTRPLMMLHQYELSEKILRWQLKFLPTLFAPLSWWKTEPELDAIRVRLAYCLRKQGKIAEADAFFNEAEIENYRIWWKQSPGSTDMSLEPEIFRYYRLIGNDVECTCRGSATEAIVLSLLSVALFVTLLGTVFASFAVSGDLKTANRVLSPLGADVAVYIQLGSARNLLREGKTKEGEAKVNELWNFYDHDLSQTSLARKVMLDLKAEAALDEGNYNTALNLLDSSAKISEEAKLKTKKKSKPGSRVNDDLMDQAKLQRDIAGGDVHAAVPFYEKYSGPRSGGLYITATRYESFAKLLEQNHDLKTASQFRELARKSREHWSKFESGPNTIRFISVGFVLFLWLLPPLSARRRPWTKK